MKKQGKPFLVRLAEVLCGYEDNSEELALQVQSLSVEMKEAKEKNKSMVHEKTKMENDLLGKISSFQEKNERMSKELNEISQNLTRKQTELLSLRNNTRLIVDDLISCIQNSEILLSSTFSKEKVMEYFINQLENAIGIFGIAVFEDVGIPANPIFHKIVATVPCEDSSKIGIISRSLSKGFRLKDKCIIEQQVEIYN